MKKGVSLIALIITIAVLIIISSAVIQKGFQRTDDARISSHNQTITQMEEEVQNYYYFNGGQLPIKKDSSNNDTIYTLPAGSALESEVSKNGDGGDKLYVIDINKIGTKSEKQGIGVGNDIFVVSEIRHNVYYVKGDTVKGITYHGKINKNAIQLTNANYDGKVNKPKLSAGMTPVKWNGTQWVAADSSNTNNDWYDYSKPTNKWANARLNDGSMLVWIPRYTYKISPDPAFPATSGEHKSIAGIIDVKFSSGTTDDTTGGYRIHPAFYWGGWNIPESQPMTKVPGGTELTGIWVGKFESSNNGSGKVKIVDNVTGWWNIGVDSIFTTCRNMQSVSNANIYGISTDSNVIDTHMMKNSEWGAVAYLSKYTMGNVEVAINPNTGFITANGNIVYNKAQSTTGNEHGIYDMSGSLWEYMASYVNNNNVSVYGNTVYMSNVKYKDIFPKSSSDSSDEIGNYAGLSQAYGHALYETSAQHYSATSWYNDASQMAYNDAPWIVRSGYYADTTGAGLFYFKKYYGFSDINGGFRVTIAIP